jgi:transposase
MRTSKIDTKKLKALADKGLSCAEIGEQLGVHKATVSRRLKRLNLDIAKEVQLVEAHRVVQEHLDTVKQLKQINDAAQELLTSLMAWNRGDPEALQVLESQVRKVRVGKTEKFVDEFKFKDPRELALRAMQEIRGQLKLQNETLELLHNLEAVRGFQAEIIKLLKDIDPEIANEFIRRIEQRQALRRAVRLV